MESASSTERRYNTRFRGVPKSVLKHSKGGKKRGPKPKNPSPHKTDAPQNDIGYSKPAKKSKLQHIDMPITIKEIKKELVEEEEVEVQEPEPEEEEEELLINSDDGKSKVSDVADTEENGVFENIMTVKSEEMQLSNGVHHDPPSEDEEGPSDDLVIKAEDYGELELEIDVDVDVEEKEPDIKEGGEEEIKSPFEKVVAPKLQEFVVSEGTGSKSVWITSKEKLSFNNCNVASYNPKSKMFRCVVCQAVGFMSRIGEHYLGTHCNAKVFQCPQCTYCSAWWRCVRNHMSKNHGVSNAPASMWKNQPLLDEIMQLLQNLKYSVDCEDRVVRVAENSGKRYICPKCPYATDRRDLYNRHENIHREEKPFQCYVCHKLFNRADHVKKHFCRIHKDYDYDINLIRRLPSKRSRLPVSPYNGMNNSSMHLADPPHNNMQNNKLPSPFMSMPTGSSQLLNCLTGPSPMLKANSEMPYSCLGKDDMHPKDNNFQKSHSNLLSYLTRTNFPSKPPLLEMTPGSGDPSGESFSGKRLQEGAMAAYGFPRIVPKEYICPYCPWKCGDMWSLRMHTATHYNNACILCNFRSTQESDLELHMWDCHRKRPCNKCNFLADSIMMLDAHIKEMHTTRQVPFRCRVCSQPFEVRSDMEAHCIFIHNQILRECKKDGCDFCSTDPEVLEAHRREKHCPTVTPITVITTPPAATSTPITGSLNNSSDSLLCADIKSASRTQCLYCGCDFADFQSLTLHEIIFHENPLQIAGRRPLDPYQCSVCGYATPKQLMMMEHLRTHTGQELYCRAGDGCFFRTPYDTVLREHVLQSHCTDEAIVRCPHCGMRCSSHNSLVVHYKKHHHLFSCELCEEVEQKYFVSTNSSSYLETSLAALFPHAKRVAEAQQKVIPNRAKGASKQNVHSIPTDVIIVDTVRRSRKQSQPRKVVVAEGEKSETTAPDNASAHPEVEGNSFVRFYARKLKIMAQLPLLKCRLCSRRPRYFRHKKNFAFHTAWHYLKRYTCDKCTESFRHRYQVLLHNMREHSDR